MSTTKHLDTAISILRAPAKKRVRQAQVVIVVNMYGGTQYSITVNGRIVEEGVGDTKLANEHARQRAEAVQKLGKTVMVIEA